MRYAFTSLLAAAGVRERCLALLSDDERARRDRFRFERDQDSYLLGHALVRGTLSTLLGVAPRALQFEAGEHGRPELVSPSAWPALRFNLAHTEGLVACAFALEHDVGVDVEHVGRRVEIVELAKTVFSESEYATLFACPTEQAQRTRFFELWTLKEAYIKAVGKGLALPLREISFELETDAGPRVAFGAAVADEPGRWQLHLQHVRGGHVLAAALGCASGRTRVEECQPQDLEQPSA